MLQNPRNIDTMLESILRFPLSPSPSEFIMKVAWIFIIVYLSMVVFEFLFRRVPLFNPGALIGLGVVGIIGVLGFVLKHWDAVTGIAVCLLGGCIGSGWFRFDEQPQPNGRLAIRLAIQ